MSGKTESGTGNGIPPGGGALKRTLIHRGAKFDFEQVEYTGSDGRPLRREVVRHPGAVVILPVLGPAGGPGARIVLIRNWRVAPGKQLWELPAGTREKGEPAGVTAARELEEETGYRADRLVEMGSFYTSPGLSDELMWAYVATGLSAVPQRLEVDERITVHPTPLVEVMGMIERGELIDAKSMLAILWGIRKGLLAGAD